MKRALLLSLAGLLVLSSGCRKHGTDYTSSENIGDVSFIVSEKAAESEVISSAENVSSTLSANVAQGSSVESTAAKPDKTVSQVREQPKTSSAAPTNTDTAQTQPEIKPETPANATAADTKAVADRVIYYLNKARADIGSGELKRLPRLTVYAEYRSSQLPSNFAHDISDWFAAAKATGYGRYTEMPDGSGSYTALICDRNTETAFEVMLAVCGHPPEIYCRGQPPFSLTFFKEREQKLCRYDICIVEPGRETVVSAMLESADSNCRVIIAVLESTERGEYLRIPCDTFICIEEKTGYRFYKGGKNY